MNEINIYIGGQIRKYRKANGMTLQQLADVIHKSRATVCKYENGEISIDIATLYEISQALQVSFGQLTSYQPTLPPSPPPTVGTLQRSPFFQAKRLYFYFYDGRYHRLKDGVIDIHEHAERPGTYVASFTLCSVSGNGCSNESYYTGNVVYSDMLIRFTFFIQLNPLEEDLLYIFNPLEMRDYTDGLLCGISSADLMPCAFRCLVTLNPQELDESLRQRLLFSKQESRRWGKLNMLLIGNRSAEDSAFLCSKKRRKKGEKDVSVLLLFIFRYCLFPLGDVHLGQRICLRGDTQGFIINMGVDLRGIQVVMSQNLLDRPDIHAVLQHQRCRRVPQLMRRILGGVQTGL